MPKLYGKMPVTEIRAIHDIARQIEANRRNALLSTGPITEGGKLGHVEMPSGTG